MRAALLLGALLLVLHASRPATAESFSGGQLLDATAAPVAAAMVTSPPTASGLVFIAAAMDGYLRAVDFETGEESWKAHLPAGGQAASMTYRPTGDRRQLIVIATDEHDA